jgi:excisionase family DNA binding protein
MVTQTTKIGELVTIDGASKIKGVSYQTLYRWIVRNDIPRVRVGSAHLVRLADLSKYQPRY